MTGGGEGQIGCGLQGVSWFTGVDEEVPSLAGLPQAMNLNLILIPIMRSARPCAVYLHMYRERQASFVNSAFAYSDDRSLTMMFQYLSKCRRDGLKNMFPVYFNAKRDANSLVRE